jgi:UDP-N-acetylglucosamine 3-dehydrogenase
MMVKVGIIGAGSIARHRHLPEVTMNPHAEVSAICDTDEGRAQKIAQQYHCKAFTDYWNMIQDPDLDALIVAATNTTHAEMTIAALEAGKHVLCEKPIATTLTDAQNMILAAEKSGKKLMIAHNQRLEPAHKKAKEIIKSGKLGRVLTFSSFFGHPGPETWAIDGPDTWFYQKDITGLGVLGDLAIHKLDLLRWLLEDNFIEVSAFMGTLSKTYPSGEAIDVEDNAICLLKTAKGVMGTVTASWSYQKENNSTTIYCEKGVIEIYVNPDFPLVVNFDHQHAEFHKIGIKSTNVEQVKSGIVDAFISAIEKNQAIPIPGIEGYKALEAVIACQQSAQSGKTIKIDKTNLE